MFELDQRLQTELVVIRQQGLRRARKMAENAAGPTVVLNGKQYLNFCSNDYLGLANDRRIRAALKNAVDEAGSGSGAAHLITGHHREHHALEEELADFTGRERALLFSTGYMANLGAITALANSPEQTIWSDALNHASLIDGCRLAKAQTRVFAHGEIASIAPQAHDLVVSDGVFSMDGNVAKCAEIAAKCRKNNAIMLIDDAHGFGVLGENGGGCTARLSARDVPVLVGTLGKAFGTFGAFVAGSEALIEYLIQRARTYIYTTALPPAVAAATRESLRIVQNEHWRREHLQALIKQFRAGASELGLSLMASSTPIQPILVGDSARAMQLAEQLREQGVLITAIRPPTVPDNTARLRVTLSAAHLAADVEQLLAALAVAR